MVTKGSDHSGPSVTKILSNDMALQSKETKDNNNKFTSFI
jgi:hypothetical protein